MGAATLADRYSNDRFLPDKAIDLVDEAASRLRMEIDSMPAEIDEATRLLTRMQIEATALAQETSPDSKERLFKLRKEIPDREEEDNRLKAQWQSETESLSGLKPLDVEHESQHTPHEHTFTETH